MSERDDRWCVFEKKPSELKQSAFDVYQKFGVCNMLKMKYFLVIIELVPTMKIIMSGIYSDANLHCFSPPSFISEDVGISFLWLSLLSLAMSLHTNPE